VLCSSGLIVIIIIIRVRSSPCGIVAFLRSRFFCDFALVLSCVLLFLWPSYRFAFFKRLHRFADILLRRFYSVRLASFIVRFLVGGRFALCTLGLASGDGSTLH